MNVAVVIGNPKPRSRTYQAAIAVAEKLSGKRADLIIEPAATCCSSRCSSSSARRARRAGPFLLQSEYGGGETLDGWLTRSRPQVLATQRERSGAGTKGPVAGRTAVC